MTEADQVAREPKVEPALWWGMFAGPIAWAFDLGFSYSLVQHACSTGHFYVLYLIDGICGAVALSGFFLAYGAYKRFPGDVKEEGGRPQDRAHFQAVTGMLFSLSFTVVILALSLPRWILSPCS